MPTALIADDEPLLRAALKTKLARLWPELTVVAELETGERVAEVVAAERPQIAFLDIQMPKVTGLEAARRVAGQVHVVFVTAYDQYAIEAFERGAVDYLLKPVEDERLALTIGRVKERLASSAPPADLSALADLLAARLAPPKGTEYLRWIKASAGSQVRMVPVESVLYFDADEKYTRVVTREGEHFIRKPIRELIEELDPEQFWQIHRSTIVNARAVAGVKRGDHDNAELSIKDRPEKLTVSRSFTHLFRQM